MINRWIGIATLSLMLTANAALFVRDLLPNWLVGDPPPAGFDTLATGQQRRIQVGIYNELGKRVGRSWTVGRRSEKLVTVDTWTLLYPVTLPQDVVTPRLRVHTNIKYLEGIGLENLEIDVVGLGILVKLHGGHVPPNDFPCRWQIGERRGRFVLNADAMRTVGDMVRPFDRLPGLYVGQAWRMELVNPLNSLTQIVPGWKSSPMATQSVLVRVTGTETITHNGGLIETFRIEADQAVAWAAPDGRVLRQEVELPLLGKLVLLDEPFDQAAFSRGIMPHLDDE